MGVDWVLWLCTLSAMLTARGMPVVTLAEFDRVRLANNESLDSLARINSVALCGVYREGECVGIKRVPFHAFGVQLLFVVDGRA